MLRSQHDVIRRKAFHSTLKSANSMAQYYNKKKRVQVEDVRVGDAVTVGVPKLDRAGMDFPRLAGVVHSTHGTACTTYYVATAFGILTTRFSGGDLQRYSGEVKTNTSKSVSLREAAKQTHPENKFVKKRCGCKSGCQSNRCVCRANKIHCSTHCHAGRSCCNEQPVVASKARAVLPPTSHVTAADMSILDGSGWLNDTHMKVASDLLKAANPEVSGLLDPVLQQSRHFRVPAEPHFVQMINIDGCHWATVCNIGQPERTVGLYDSLLHRPTAKTLEVISGFVEQLRSTVVVMPVQRQPNALDCGPYAIAFATSLVHGQEPTERVYVPGLRQHLKQCLQAGVLNPFPASPIFQNPKILHKCECSQNMGLSL